MAEKFGGDSLEEALRNFRGYLGQDCPALMRGAGGRSRRGAVP